MAKVTAIIDIGSNSARLMIFQKSSRFAFNTLHEAKSRVRISEGAYEHGGSLQPLAMNRAFLALKSFASIIKDYKCRKTLCVATSALRDAPNKGEFIARVRRELGINIRVIDGNKEAFLGGVAAMNLLDVDEAVTIDIGGGSCELAKICNKQVVQTISLDLGTVRLKELFFDKGDKEGAKEYIHAQVSRLDAAFLSDTAIAIGGSARAISKSIMQKNGYLLGKIHGFTYDFGKESDYIEALSNSSTMKLKKFYISKDRFDTIREGTFIFAEVLKAVEAKRVVTSGVGVREGLFLQDLLRAHNYRFPANFNVSLKSLLDRFGCDDKESSFLQRLSVKIFHALKEPFGLDEAYIKQISYASRLLNIGVAIEFYDYHKHGQYLIENELQYALSHHDAFLVSTLVRFQKKKLPPQEYIETYQEFLPSKEVLQTLSYILSLAKALNADRLYPRLSIDFKPNQLSIQSDTPLYLAKEEIKALKKPKSFAVIFS